MYGSYGTQIKSSGLWSSKRTEMDKTNEMREFYLITALSENSKLSEIGKRCEICVTGENSGAGKSLK